MLRPRADQMEPGKALWGNQMKPIPVRREVKVVASSQKEAKNRWQKIKASD